MYLFIIGLEMQPSHLWGCAVRFWFGHLANCGLCAGADRHRHAIWPEVANCLYCGGRLCTDLYSHCDAASGRPWRSEPAQRAKIVSILLFEDLLIVPLLALVAFMAPTHVIETTSSRLESIGIGLLAIAGLIAAGYWLLNPLFRLLAASKAREVMTAAALLVVLGAALLMQVSGLSMAMGAFLAGVLLSESTFRHQIEADIEPFRGILLGLFFLGVGMSLDLTVVRQNWPFILAAVLAFMAVKPS